MNLNNKKHAFPPKQQALLDQLREINAKARARNALMTPAEKEAQAIRLAERDRRHQQAVQETWELTERVIQYEAKGGTIPIEKWKALPGAVRLRATIARRNREREEALQPA